MRLAIASDTHLETTGREPIARLIAGIAKAQPDALVLAGDLGNPALLFEECLSLFARLDMPVAVLAGNHDLWVHSPREHSRELFEEQLPAITRAAGFHWLDGDEPLVLGNVGIAGSIGWYDYSAREASYNQSDEEIVRIKPTFAWDARHVDWAWSDPEFAAACRARLARQLDALSARPSVDRIVVVTHVPIFESQIARRPDDRDWSLGQPFFGHLTMGALVERYPRVTHVVSGHTHVGMHGEHEREGAPPIATGVVASDYRLPKYLLVETDEGAIQ